MGTLNVLLVDDDRSLVTTLSYGLRKAMGEAVSVAVCFSSSEALSMLAAQTFHMVISDFNMPGTSGLEFLEKLRQDHRNIILVLITAYGTDALEEQARQLGAGYLPKPFEPSLLVQMIRGLIPDKEAQGGTENVSRMMDELGTPADLPQSIRLEGRLHE